MIVTRKYTAAMLQKEKVESEKEPDISEDNDVFPPPSEPSNHSYTKTSPPSLIGGSFKKLYLQTPFHQKVNTISDLLAHNGLSSEEEGGSDNTRMVEDEDRNECSPSVVPSGDIQEKQDSEANISLKKRKNLVLEDQEVN